MVPLSWHRDVFVCYLTTLYQLQKDLNGRLIVDIPQIFGLRDLEIDRSNHIELKITKIFNHTNRISLGFEKGTFQMRINPFGSEKGRVINVRVSQFENLSWFLNLKQNFVLVSFR